jgi:hypothetical protein
MKYLYIFLLGGTLLAGSRYLADKVHSPSLSASMVLFPMSIIVGMFITKKREFKMYCLNIISVTIFGLLSWLLIYYYIENYNFDIKYIMIFGLPLFFLFQYGRYCLCDLIYPPMNFLTK